jgi:hypothetical protein
MKHFQTTSFFIGPVTAQNRYFTPSHEGIPVFPCLFNPQFAISLPRLAKITDNCLKRYESGQLSTKADGMGVTNATLSASPPVRREKVAGIFRDCEAFSEALRSMDFLSLATGFAFGGRRHSQQNDYSLCRRRTPLTRGRISDKIELHWV